MNTYNLNANSDKRKLRSVNSNSSPNTIPSPTNNKNNTHCKNCEKLESSIAILSKNITLLEDRLKETIETRIINIQNEIKSYISNTTTEIQKSIQDLNTKINLIEDNTYNKSDIDSKLNNVVVDSHKNLINSKFLNEISEKIVFLEKSVCAKDLVVNNVPITDIENLQTIFEQISLNIGFNGNFATVENMFRVKSGTIIIKFKNFHAKQEFFKCYMLKRNLKQEDLGFGSSSRIYISESLPASTLNVLKYANHMRRENKLHKVRTSRGVISIQLKENQDFIKIYSKQQLADIVI